LVVAGRLSPAASDQDVRVQAELVSARGMTPDKIDVMLFDQRSHKPRKIRHKPVIKSMGELTS
jgi:hypothetical protein